MCSQVMTDGEFVPQNDIFHFFLFSMIRFTKLTCIYSCGPPYTHINNVFLSEPPHILACVLTLTKLNRFIFY